MRTSIRLVLASIASVLAIGLVPMTSADASQVHAAYVGCCTR
jgi:hypothetical protein